MRRDSLLMVFVALVGALGLAAGLALPGAAQQDPATARSIVLQQPAKPADEKKPEEKKKEEEKPFDEVVKDMEKIEGLFTFYRKADEDKLLIEIRPDQLDKDFIYSSKMEQGTGERGLYGTIMMDQFIFQWQRLGKRVHFVQKNTRFAAAPGSPAARAVKNSFTDSVLAAGKIVSLPHPERKSVLIDLRDILLAGDLHGLAQYFKQVYRTGYNFDKDNSGFVMVKSFPLNAEIGTVARFRAGEFSERGSTTIPDVRSVTLRFRYSLVALPAEDYRPRLADDRVGYFMDQYMDFTSDKPDSPFVRYVNRWKLQKKDPKAAVSEPVEPIVFWLENSIPAEYRDSIREGILLWNPAFEKAGFKNAMVVKQQPDDADWDPADIRYNTIRWFVGYDATFAIGPSHSNPYTGQILDADIGISEGILRLGARRRYELYINPVQRLQALKAESDPAPGPFGRNLRGLCAYANGLAEQASLVYDVLSARPGWNPEKEKEFVNQYVRELIAHEVGHTLGLRHNFRASVLNRLDQLADQQRNRSVGLAASVMDYNPAVIALKGEKQGDYLPQVAGSYDQWAIQYAYTPLPAAKTPQDELPELGKLAAQGTDPLHPYATDEDASDSARGLDPRNTRFDFAEDPLAYFSHEFKVVNELWANMESKLETPGESYEVLRRAFNASWTPYLRGSWVAMKYIGGIYHNRVHVGDPNGGPPFVPVPAAEQRRALEFLAQQVWSPDAFQAPARLLNKLQYDRFPDFNFTLFSVPRLDYPLHDSVLFVQSDVLSDLYDPIKLARLQDLEMKYPDPNDRFTLADMFVGVRNAIWSELEAGGSINSFRRNLQRAHLTQLIRLVLKPQANTPEDAVTLARADLVELQNRIDRALGSGSLDYTTRAHLEETRARIRQTLEAQPERSL